MMLLPACLTHHPMYEKRSGFHVVLTVALVSLAIVRGSYCERITTL
jgi:hypothetical protein